MTYLLRHLLAALQDLLVVVGLNGQDVQPGELIPQIHRVRGKRKHITVRPGLYQEAQWLRSVVKSSKWDNIHGTDIELLHGRYDVHALRFQSIGGALAHVNGHAVLNKLLHSLCVVLVLMAHQAGGELGKRKAGQCFQLLVGDPALQENAGFIVIHDVSISGRG